MTDNSETNIKRKLTTRIITIIVLAICLFITTFALTASILVQDNLFETGKVDIELSGEYEHDNRIIKENEFLFEPGMTVVKPANVTNKGTWAVYCKLYFRDVEGGLADILDITILDVNNSVLYKGKASDFNKAHAALPTAPIAVNETKTYQVVFHYPEEAGNAGQGSWLSFTMEAEAVQTKNNPTKEF